MLILFWSYVFSVLISVEALKFNDRAAFLKDFIKRKPVPANVVSFIKNTGNDLDMVKELFAFGITYKTMKDLRFAKQDHNVIYVADIKDQNTLDVLAQAEASKLLLAPSRWLLFFGNNEFMGYTETAKLLGKTNKSIETWINDLDNFKKEVNIILATINIAMNTEVYIAVHSNHTVHLFEVYRKQIDWPLEWDHNGSWMKELGFREPPPRAVLAVRRRNMEWLPLTVTTVFTKNDTLKNMEEFKRRDVNTLSKYCYHMGVHVAAWLNATLRVNATSTWGYSLDGRTYNGMVGELQTGRADFSGTAFNPTADRLRILEYLVSPGPLIATFMFRRPALAATGNIYLLPFSTGVWTATGVLLLISAFMLFLTSYREPKYISRGDKVKVPERLLDGLHDTLCLVFQQGTPKDPVSISSRQVLLMGLMAFLFLYTAYSAYVVALLQSSSNNINSVEALARSPLQLGLEDVVYTKNILPLETGPAHKMLWKRRIEPQGEKAYYTAEEGIRRVREGMFAFHVEETVGYMEIQKTFTEDEKCNLAEVKYLTSRYLYIGVSLRSQVKEQIRIGLHRVLELGLQSRSERRVLERRPKCGAGVAVFTPVQLRDVSPAFHVTLTGYAIALMFLFVEKWVWSRSQAKIARRRRPTATSQGSLDSVITFVE